MSVKQTLTYLGNLGSALPAALGQHRGNFFLKRASGAEDELYIGVRDASDVMQLRQITLGGGGGGSVSAATATLAFGATPVSDRSFTVTDTGITAATPVLATVAGFAGFARDMDEIWADPIQITVAPAAGQMTVYAHAALGRVSGDYPLVYVIG